MVKATLLLIPMNVCCVAALGTVWASCEETDLKNDNIKLNAGKHRQHSSTQKWDCNSQQQFTGTHI